MREITIKFDDIIRHILQNPIHALHLYTYIKNDTKTKDLLTNIVTHRSQQFPPIEFKEEMFFCDEEDITVYIDRYTRKKEFPNGSPIIFEHYHSFFELAYIYSGNFHFIIGGKKYFLPTGTILMFNTKATHYIEPPEDGGILINILVRKSTFANSMLSIIQKNDLFFSFFLHSLYNEKIKPVIFQFSVKKESIIEEIIYHIVKEYYDKLAYSQSMMSYLFCCLLTQLTRQYQKKASKPMLKNQKGSFDIAQIIAYMSENCNSITLAQVAEHFHYSTTYISKSIHRASGKTFTELLNSFKMEKATHYLLHSDFSIEKIALLLGYSERSTFDKTFKKYHGKTPIQYRKSSN